MFQLTDENFQKEVLESDLPVLVDFYADWCGPCQVAAPILEELAKKYEGKIRFGKLNVDENPQSATKYGVMSIPTIILFKQGREVGRKIGFSGKEELETLLRQCIGNA